MRLFVFLIFLILLLLATGCVTTETRPDNQQYERPIRERPLREYNDFHRGKGRP